MCYSNARPNSARRALIVLCTASSGSASCIQISFRHQREVLGPCRCIHLYNFSHPRISSVINLNVLDSYMSWKYHLCFISIFVYSQVLPDLIVCPVYFYTSNLFLSSSTGYGFLHLRFAPYFVHHKRLCFAAFYI